MKTGQRRTFGPWTSTALVVGNMIGSGIFLLPASLGTFGTISLVGWIVTAAGSMALGFVFAQLSIRHPRAGGPYAYARQTFGDLTGFLVGWGYWISICCGNAAIATAFVGYTAVFWPVLRSPYAAAITALSAVWILTWVNAHGLRDAGRVQILTTAMKLLPLVGMGTLGLLFFDARHFVPFNASGETTLGAVTASAALTLWAFLGLESASIPADAIAEPARTIPRATIVGVLIAAVVYIASTIGIMGILPADALSVSTAPYADAARAIGGSVAGGVVAAGAVIACFGALNGWVLLQGQLPLAMARDGLFPPLFGRVSSRGTPIHGLIVSSLLVTALVMMNYTRGLVDLFTFFILIATLNTLVPYVLSSLAQLTHLVRARPPRGATYGAPVIALCAFGYSLWAISGIGWEALYWGLLLLAAGIPAYAWIRRRGRIVEHPGS